MTRPPQDPLVFSDVPVVPYDGLLGRGDHTCYHRGGPLWPDWDNQTGARHCRDGAVCDEPPILPAPARGWPGIGAAQWCGPIFLHYGHMVAEFGMRILPTALNGNRAPLLFSGFPVRRFAGRKHPLRAAPPYFRDIIAYAGVRPRRIVIDAEGLRVGALHVEPQAEQLYSVGPSAAHLDLLDGHAERMLGPRAPSGPVFISRAGQFARFAGEAYLERVMEAAGIRVVRPEEHPLEDQLKIYRNAPLAIFSEGSALHTPQLLGRCFRDVAVLNRRPGQARLNHFSLTPRCETLRYFPVPRDLLTMRTLEGKPNTSRALTLIDPAAFRAAMAELGIAVAHLWDERAFDAAERADVADWLNDARKTRPWTLPGTVAEVAAVLEAQFGDLFGLDEDLRRPGGAA